MYTTGIPIYMVSSQIKSNLLAANQSTILKKNKKKQYNWLAIRGKEGP